MIRTYKYAAAAAALALALGGAPAALVHAEDGADGSVTANAVVSARVGDDEFEARASTTASTSVRADDEDRNENATSSESAREAAKQERERSRESAKQVRETVRETVKDWLEFARESSTTTPAFSAAELRLKIEERKAELDDEEASTTPELRDVVKNANEVRLAVHALLASKELLGGIGSQVSEIAKRMNDSLATTTTAEAEIQSRGVLVRIFLGGDKKAAGAIKEQVSQNEEQIQKLQEALAQATVSAEVKAELSAQLTALEAEQARLQNLADSESKKWGLLSWLFR